MKHKAGDTLDEVLVHCKAGTHTHRHIHTSMKLYLREDRPFISLGENSNPKNDDLTGTVHPKSERDAFQMAFSAIYPSRSLFWESVLKIQAIELLVFSGI